MSPLQLLALGTMRLGAALAPKARSGWARAMQAEFEALDDGGLALAWALGCLTTAAAWRLRADGAYLLAFIAAIATSVWFRDHWQTYVQTEASWNLFGWDNTMLVLGLTLPLCVLAGAGRQSGRGVGWLLAVAGFVALSALSHGHWRDALHSAATGPLPMWVAALVALKLALPGVIAAAICWRLRADTVYVTALVGLIVVAHWLDFGLWSRLPDPGREQFVALAKASPYVTLALPCLILCLVRPDRALLTIFVTSLINGGLADGIATFALPMLADPFGVAGNLPEVPNILMALLLSWSTLGAAVAGGAAGWVLGTLRRRLTPTSSAAGLWPH